MPKNKLMQYNAELKKVREEHDRLPFWAAKIVAEDHVRMPKKKRD